MKNKQDISGIAPAQISRRRFSTLAVSGVVSGMLSGQTTAAEGVSPAEWQKIEMAARKEGRVMIYGQLPQPVADQLCADFTKLYGIRANYYYLIAGPLISKVEAEAASGEDGCDVVLGNDILWFEEMAKQGRLARPVGPSSAAWPNQYLIANTIPVVAVEPFTIVYNTNLVKTPPLSYLDLLKPEYAGGKIGVLDLYSFPIIAFYGWLEKEHGSDYLAKLAAQKPRINTTAALLQSTAAGEIWISAINASPVPLLAKQGAPVKMAYPPRAFGISRIANSVKWSKRPNAALLFVDYLMSPQAQSVLVADGQAASPLPNIPGSLLEMDTITQSDPKMYPAEVQKMYKAKFDNLFKS